MDAVAESGRKEGNPRESTRFSLDVENERVDKGTNGRTRFVRSFIFPVQLTTSRIGNHTRLMANMLSMITIERNKLHNTYLCILKGYRYSLEKHLKPEKQCSPKATE